MKYCGQCGAELKDDVKFCANCGTKCTESIMKYCYYCDNCGSELKDGARFCVNCGPKDNENHIIIRTVSTRPMGKRKPQRSLMIGITAVLVIIAVGVVSVNPIPV